MRNLYSVKRKNPNDKGQFYYFCGEAEVGAPLRFAKDWTSFDLIQTFVTGDRLLDIQAHYDMEDEPIEVISTNQITEVVKQQIDIGRLDSL